MGSGGAGRWRGWVWCVVAASLVAGSLGGSALPAAAEGAAPPAGCVVALGALPVGSATTRAGEWDSGDGCMSANGGGDRFARFVSFSVAVAVEVRFRLTSPRSSRMYLLEGAGTGGRVLASAGTGGADWAPSLWRSLEPGAYTVETSAFRAGREAGFSLTVDPMPLTPPDSRVAPLGAVAAGSALTHSGSWERGDACRSLNATASRATRHYAEYVSFTVSEPAELRFALSSARGGRLFLLEGAGTGGSVLASAASRGRAAASLRRSLESGAYTLEAASYLPEREGSFSLRVTSPLAAPTPAGALEAQVIPPRAGAKTVDVSGAFGGTVASYAAESSDSSVVAAAADGPSVTLDGVSVGTATVTVTASNAAGSAAQSFAVTVRPLAAPQKKGTLAAPALTAGASATVDVAGAFAGTVDSYTATSSDAAVVDIALDGSALTLTGVAAGTAAVTVTAANPAGSAAQAMAASVGLPPAPALGDPLAARTLQATETLTVDAAAGFTGRIDSYTAIPGDAAVLAVAVEGPTVTLTGAAAGSTTVTVTAVNAAGRAARSFNVTVDPLAAPQAAGALLARTVAVGGELPIDIADAFTGIVHTYTAASSDTAVLTTSVDGPTVTLTGAAAGSATVTLTAGNAAGSAAQALAVTVEEPEELVIALAAPSHCLGSEGTLAPGGGRRGVGHIDLTYHITGGAPPYTVTSPDAPGAARAEATGTIRVPCARRGVDLSAAGPEDNVVESGPRTLTVAATDNAGAAATADIRIEVAEDAYTTEYNGGLMHPGRTYVLGTPDQWVLITLPDGLTLQFTGLSEHNIAHFTDPTTGAELLLDWTTGTELGRTTPSTSDTTMRDSTPETSTEQTRTASKSSAPKELAIATPSGLTHGAESTEWCPYAGLSNSYVIEFQDGKKTEIIPQVAVHRRMLIGEPIRVCAKPVNTANAADDEMFKNNVKASAQAWNDSIRNSTDPTKGWNPSFPRNLFKFLEECTSTTDLALNADLTVLRVADENDNGYPVIKEAKYCGNNVTACARTVVTGTNPPMIGGDEIVVKTSNAANRRTMIHELGHFLGLGDYHTANDDKCDTDLISKQVDPLRPYFASVMAGGNCVEGSVQPRDLADLHLIYHPYARTDLRFEAVGAIGWKLDPGNPPADTGRKVEGKWEYRYVSNAVAYVVFRRAYGSTAAFTYVGMFGRSTSKVLPVRDLTGMGLTRDAIEGQVFYVFGVTGGDIEQSNSGGMGVHSTLPFDLGLFTYPLGSSTPLGIRDWSLGHGATVHGPPAMPTNVRTEIGSREVDLVWPHVPGAIGYEVYRHDTAKTIEDAATTEGHPTSYREKRNVRASTRTNCGMRVTFDGLENSRTYYFRVRAYRDGVDLGSRLSAEVSGRPYAFPPPTGSSARHSAAAGESVSPSSAESEDPCTPAEEVEPDEGKPHCRRSDGFSWVLWVDEDDDWWCDRVESADVVLTTVERCDVAGGELRPGAGGARVCAEEVLGTLRSRPGSLECEKGFSLLTVLVGGVPQQVCSKTDSVPASAKVERSCSAGYSLKRLFVQPGVVGYRCERSSPASSSTRYVCEDGYSLVRVPLGGQYCRKTAPASASVERSCSAGYSLKRFFVQPGVVGYRCERSTAAATSTRYVCRSGYRLVARLLGGVVSRYCRKATPAAASYSCERGYTRSGSACHKYVYASLEGTRCPAGWTLFFNGLYHLCRKRLTVAAKATYSCASGTLSGSECVLTEPPTSRTTYSCASGTLSGSKCVLTEPPTLKTTYSCASGRLSGSECVSTATPISETTYSCASGRLSGSKCILTDPPIVTTSYDCDDAPAGYSLSGAECVKKTTKPSTRSTIHYCDPGHTLDTENSTCRKTVTTTPTKITTYSCATDQGYHVTTNITATGTTRVCTRTITVAASFPSGCPSGYNAVLTVGEGRIIRTSCRLDRDTNADQLGDP